MTLALGLLSSTAGSGTLSGLWGTGLAGLGNSTALFVPCNCSLMGKNEKLGKRVVCCWGLGLLAGCWACWAGLLGCSGCCWAGLLGCSGCWAGLLGGCGGGGGGLLVVVGGGGWGLLVVGGGAGGLRVVGGGGGGLCRGDEVVLLGGCWTWG